MKTDELTGAALDWAVLTLEENENCAWYIDSKGRLMEEQGEWYSFAFQPSTNWAHGGPIIEREMIDLKCLPTKQGGFIWRTACADGPTPLIAAMRCYVASKLGDDIEIPEELK